MPRPSRILFDTNVYIAAISGGLGSPAFRALQESVPRTYLAAVVSAELRAGATSRAAQRAVEQFTRRAHAVGRVVAPGVATWQKAGDLLGRIRRSEPHLRSKLRGLWNDLLIALSAREIGAVVVTYDADDFGLLRRYVAFELRICS